MNNVQVLNFLRRWTQRFLMLMLVCIALGLSFLRVMTPYVKSHKTTIEKELSHLLGGTVTIQQMETGWYWFYPLLKLNDVSVFDHQVPVLQLNHLFVGIDLWHSLLNWQIQPGLMLVEDVQLTLRQTSEGWQLDGLEQMPHGVMLSPRSYDPLLRWFLLQQKIKIKRVNGRICFKDAPCFPLDSLTFDAVYRRGHYRLKGQLRWGEQGEGLLQIKGDLLFPSHVLEKTEGELFVSTEHLDFKKFEPLLRQLPYHLQQGLGRGQFWIKVHHGRVKQIQSTLTMRDLHYEAADHVQHDIDHFSANLAWVPVRLGWELSADKVLLSIDHRLLPENAGMIHYEPETQDIRIFLKQLSLTPSVLTLLPAKVQARLKPYAPTGVLYETQLGFHAGDLNYVLSRFSDLAWRGTGSWPHVRHVSGALYWEPTAGRLELDQPGLEIEYPHHRALSFQTAQIAMNWHQVSGLWQLQLDQLILEHPYLLLSAEGLWDGFSKQETGHLKLDIDWSSKKSHRWLAYLPDISSKPRLSQWLKKDIRRIGALNGALSIDGALADFPFDHAPGKFSIHAQLEDVDLWFHRAWPMAQHMDAMLHVDQRHLGVDILHGELGAGLGVQGLHLTLNHLGLGQETLVAQGRIQAPWIKMLRYIEISPLKKKLSDLAVLSVKQPLDLDLSVVVPFYADQEDISVQGSLLFDHHDVDVHVMQNQPLMLHDVLGTLFFDEKGVSDSQLQAKLWEQPLQVSLQSWVHPHPATIIRWVSDVAIASLRDEFPLLTKASGHVPLEGQIILREGQHAWNHISIDSSLQGLALNLPAPFKKEALMRSPFHMTLDYRAHEGMRLRWHAFDHMKGDIWFQDDHARWVPKRGLVCIDCDASTTVSATTNGVLFRANFPKLDWAEWGPIMKLFLKDSSETSSLFKQYVLNVGQLWLFGQRYDDLEMVFHQAQQVWHAEVRKHRALWMDIDYDPKQKACTAHVTEWHDQPHASLSSPEPLNPQDFPSVMLTLDRLFWHEKLLGRVVMQAVKEPDAWRVVRAELASEAYTLLLKGLWLKQDMKHQTEVEATLNIKKLSSILGLWDVPHVVDAREGTLSFIGGWLGDFRAFSLGTLYGDVEMYLKNGRITHFDPATEKKLGLGRLLSILSLQTIPRRLKLDFSDLANDGYSFDQYRGQFHLKDGIMMTDQSWVDGPVAYVSMKGSLDLQKRLYDLDLRVSPHITASLPVVATIAGGPIAGIATWAASKILKSGVDKVTGYTYKITGPWLEPVVQQVHIYKVHQ